MWWLALFLAQDVPPQSQAERVRSAMEESLDKQRASIRQQIRAVTGATPRSGAEGFTVPPPAVTSVSFHCEPVAAPELSRLIDKVAGEQKLDPALVREVARQESGFRPCAVSPKGAEGLMQLMPATQAQLEVRDPFDPQQSLTAGAKLLKQLLERYHGDLALALSAYNAGITRVDRTFAIPEIPETKDYVTDILGRLGK